MKHKDQELLELIYRGLKISFWIFWYRLYFKAEALVWGVPQHMILVRQQHQKVGKGDLILWSKYTDKATAKDSHDKMNNKPNNNLN